jgi:dTDP-4-amino-4,6-dideoxygalactose transaminase
MVSTTSQTSVIPLLDLRAQYRQIREEVMAAITRVAESQAFVLGAEVESLEHDLAGYCRADHAIGCASGSDALLLSLMALGIGPGDEVLTTPFTFFATAGSICHAGAKPVFVDVQQDTFNLDPDMLGAVLDSHPRVRAILPVHLFGGCADMDPILSIAAERGIPVIEDAAQSIGAEYRGRRAGSLGQVGCFSFFPSKNLGAFGDGGMIVTSDPALAKRLRSLRVHGSTTKYIYDAIGFNSRLDALQAAILAVKFRYLDEWIRGRQRNAELYRRLFRQAGLPVCLPEEQSYQTRHIYNQFVIRCPQRDELREYLRERGAGSEVYYPLPLHLQECFSHLGYRAGDFPISERLAGEVLALPIYPELTPEQVATVVDLISSFYRRAHRKEHV